MESSRATDIPLLVRHFVEEFKGTAPIRFTESAIDTMARYHWPGNVRELGNFCERV